MRPEVQTNPSMTDALVAAIVELLPRVRWSPSELADHQADRLLDIVSFARERSPFHACRLAGLDLPRRTSDALEQLPVMTKRDLMGAWDDVVTDPRLDLATARSHLDEVDRNGVSLLHDEYLVFQTGGSTGEPGVFAWHAEEFARWGASSLRWSAAAGLGPPARTVWVGARSHRHPSAAAAVLAHGDPGLSVPVDQPLADIVARLNDLRPDSLMVVGSMLALLNEAARDGALAVRPERLGVFGDAVAPGAKDDAFRTFGVMPVESYPSTDAGHLGQQAPDEPGIYLNEDLLLIECVDEHHRPVPPGVLCDHLLVTSLHQRTLPLLRYRIDDRVVVDLEPGRRPAYRRLAHIDGRSDDLFRYAEVVVHPHVFRSVLSRSADICDYQVVQNPNGADVAFTARGPVGTRSLAEDLTSALRGAGLADPVVHVSRVDRLGHNSTGKRRHFVPLLPAAGR